MRYAAFAAIPLFTIALLQFVQCAPLAAEDPIDHCVRATATVLETPATITLSWPATVGAGSYVIYRRDYQTTTSWAFVVATLPATTLNWSDHAIVRGARYEYRIDGITTTSGPNAVGYVLAGVDVPTVDHRGSLVLVVDATVAGPLAAELVRLRDDIAGDGWTVIRHDVARDAPVTAVKALIHADYLANPADVKSVFLFGHVPVPYSGLLNPDGHPEHLGAWPADCYYADMDGVYTDSKVDWTSISPPRTQNTPGDGKFDQSSTPGRTILESGRVDLANMPSFALSETELLRQYLNRDHAFRSKAFTAQARALVDDNFGDFSGEAFAQNGWRNCSALLGPANVSAQDWFTVLAHDEYLMAYGCGPGWFQGAGGIGQTADFAATPSRAVFTMLFGSFFGDWDNPDNFLRAPLANAGYGLTCMWGGRPNCFLHQMGLGETIGSSARIAMSESAYQTPFEDPYPYVHVALMGDPTLRLHIVAPPPSAIAAARRGSAHLSWAGSADARAGYHVYRSANANGPFVRRTALPVLGNAYDDVGGSIGYRYLVKSVTMETTPSGSYVNTSVGAIAAPMPNAAGQSLAVQSHAMPDLDGDRIGDLLWYHGPSGLISVWPGALSANHREYGPVAPSSGWTLFGAADLDGDGRSDLVWVHQAGLISVWPSGDASKHWEPGTVAPSSGWRLAGFGDFDADGAADMLFIHTDGALSIWPRGVSARHHEPLLVPASSGWRVCAIGDFDGVHRSDLLWRHAPTGALTVWRGGDSANHWEPPRVDPASGWNVVGSADVDGDGHSDIVWRNTISGEIVIWSAGRIGRSLGTVAPSSGWILAALIDADGDGAADLVWQHQGDGVLSIWPAGESTLNWQPTAVTTTSGWRLVPTLKAGGL